MANPMTMRRALLVFTLVLVVGGLARPADSAEVSYTATRSERVGASGDKLVNGIRHWFWFSADEWTSSGTYGEHHTGRFTFERTSCREWTNDCTRRRWEGTFGRGQWQAAADFSTARFTATTGGCTVDLAFTGTGPVASRTDPSGIGTSRETRRTLAVSGRACGTSVDGSWKYLYAGAERDEDTTVRVFPW